jgi:hypothetical protein
VDWIVDHVIDQYVPEALKRDIVRQFGKRIETLIEADTYQFQQLTTL